MGRIILVKEANSVQTIQALNTIFVRFGWPIQIWSDNGTTFTSEEFRGFCESKRICQIFSAPFHPRSNGEAKCMVRTFKSMLKKVNPVKSEVMSAGSDMLLTYRTTPHATMGMCPYEMVFKATPQTLMYCIHLDANSQVLGKQLKQQDASLNSRSDSLFLVGERVWVRDFRMRFPNKWIAGMVVARSGPLLYVVQVGSGCWRRHQDQMCASNPHRNYEEETAAQIASQTVVQTASQTAVQTASHTAVQMATQTAAQPAMQAAAQLSAPPAMQLTESINAQESTTQLRTSTNVQESAPSLSEYLVVACMPQPCQAGMWVKGIGCQQQL